MPCGCHIAIPGFLRDASPLARLARQNPVPAGGLGTEPSGYHRFTSGDHPVRKDILLCDLPSRRVPRRCRQSKSERQKGKVFIFKGDEMAPLWSLGGFRGRIDRWSQRSRRPTGTIQRMGKNSPEPSGSRVAVGQQLIRIDRREA